MAASVGRPGIDPATSDVTSPPPSLPPPPVRPRQKKKIPEFPSGGCCQAHRTEQYWQSLFTREPPTVRNGNDVSVRDVMRACQRLVRLTPTTHADPRRLTPANADRSVIIHYALRYNVILIKCIYNNYYT